MIYYLQNSFYKIAVNSLGAELKSFYQKSTDTELIWQADPTFWAKSSPVLFPIVGSINQQNYLHNGQNYTLSRHGFARDMEFVLETETEESLTFLLKSNYKSKPNYPFKFELRIKYELSNKLTVTYLVTNTDSFSPLLFSIGAHPAFNVPFAGGNYHDYFLEFESEIKTLDRRCLNTEGLLNGEIENINLIENKLPISNETFAKDAIVLGPHQQIKKVVIGNKINNKKLVFECDDFPYFGIWAAKYAPFVCLEPWCGVADNAGFEGELKQKEGIVNLNPLEVFERSFSVQMS